MLAVLATMSSKPSFTQNLEPWASVHRLLDEPTSDGLLSMEDFTSLQSPMGGGEVLSIERWATSSTEKGEPGLSLSDLRGMFSSIAISMDTDGI